MKQKKASSTIYIIIFILILLAFLAFAVDGTIILTYRARLQNAVEMTALTAASEFYTPLYATAPQIEDQVRRTATSTFMLLKKDSLQNANLVNKDGNDNDINLNDGIDSDVEVKSSPNKVLISAEMIAQPFFLSFLGVEGIKLEAKACAESDELSVSAYYQGINWLTVSAAYLSDILSEDTNLHDTAILKPLGNFNSASYKSGIADFGLIEGDVNKPLSLGPGGFITIKLPAPIINKPGPDLSIKETGDALEGYFVFIGLDNNPNNPYVQYSKPGDGITWVNISCSGVSDEQDPANIVGAYDTATAIGPEKKFYGSGKFDIGDDCITGTANDISMAKYLRIVDDNQESAFVKATDGNFYKTMIYGEASTATSGADIYEVKVLNYIKLVQPSIF